MRKIERNVKRKNIKKKIVGYAAMAVLMATMIIGGSVTSANASGLNRGYTIAALSELSSNIEKAKLIDISKVPINDNKISITISESGDYKLTGTNLINVGTTESPDWVYVDVTIKVTSNVVANLYLDGLHIVNDDHRDESHMGSSAPGGDMDGVSPFIIQGVANVYVINDSTIDVVEKSCDVAGELNFVESKNNATLKIGLSCKLGYDYWLDIIAGGGLVSFLDANVSINGTTGPTDTANYNFYINADTYFGSTNFRFGKK